MKLVQFNHSGHPDRPLFINPDWVMSVEAASSLDSALITFGAAKGDRVAIAYVDGSPEVVAKRLQNIT